ncbi:MAG TPA: SusC/RagA family TonB-linked outer membrane protein [Porphyromonadaceae bacterium]|nr:SusC/RagA family TonB-linked outer membrane protein [Porphyromonadaceae bacterium]
MNKVLFSVPSSESLLVAQKQKATGTVLDQNGDPLIGVNVIVVGTTDGTITDIDGKFSVTATSGNTLRFSYIGYKPVEMKYTGKDLVVKMEEDSEALEEVVVTGYGGVQKAKTLTASAVNVKMESIAKLPVTSVSDGLGGRVTGITSQSKSGAPGETTKIWIRGGDQILYVIDDVVMETSQGEIFFNRLRPDDIASMSVLKDASATAIYGPRANNGVIVVNTKRGTAGQLDIVVNQKLSIMTPSYRPKVMSTWDYANTKNELYAANFMENPAYNDTEMSKYYMGHLNQQGKSRQEILGLVNDKYGLGYTMDEINDLFNPYVTQGGDIENYYQTYDPWDFFNHTQPMSQTNVSVRGGSDRIRYYSSLGYLTQKGISDTFGYDQYNAMINSESFLLKDKSLRFTLNLNGIMSDMKRPAAGDNVFNSALFERSDRPNLPQNWTTGLNRAGGPDAMLRTGFNDTHDYRLQSSASLRWDLPWVKGLAVSGSVNFNTSYTMRKSFSHDQEDVFSNPASTTPNNYNPDNANVWQQWSNYLLTTSILQIDYNKSIGKHNFSAMVNYQSQNRTRNSTAVKAKGYPTTYVPQIDAGTTFVEKRGTEEKWGSSSYIGRITYDYGGKYLFQYSANYNGSLSYSPKKRWGFFQAGSAGWVMTEESFIKDNMNKDLINMIKIRAGYGVVGGEIGSPFSFMNQYDQAGLVLLGENMAANAAWKEKHVANDLTWSNSKQLSAGVDFALLKDRLSGSFDTYLYKNNGAAMDMNQDLIYTPILGMPNTPQINAPFETSRKGGIEVSLNWTDRIGEVSYRIGGNYSYWDQRVTRHASKSTDWYYNGLDNIGRRAMQGVYYASWVTDGLFGSLDQMYDSYLHFSRNHNTGTFIMQDLNGDGILNIGDYAWNNRAGSTPLSLYGITLGGEWKGFDFEIFFQGAANVTGSMPSPMRSQQDFYWNYGKYFFQESYLPSNGNVDANLPLPVNSGQGWGYNYVDRWVYDASYFKLKNISLRYNLKRDVLRNVNVIKGLDVSFIINNVYTWVNGNYPLKGMSDPEYIPTESIWGDSGKLGGYPTQRSYTLGLTLTL